MNEKTKLEAALDELLSGKSTEEIVGPEGLLRQLTKAVLERAMDAELTHHLGYEKGEPSGGGSGNSRATGKAGSRCRETSEPSNWPHRAIATEVLNPRSCPNTSDGSPASIKRFCPCMRGV